MSLLISFAFDRRAARKACEELQNEKFLPTVGFEP